MVMTRSNGGSTTAAGERPPRRVVARAPGMPTGRALVGGALVALAGVATFVTWQQSAGTPDHSYAVASRALHPGDAVTADAVRFVAIDLPPGVAGVAFPDPASLEGRVTVAPVAAGELLQEGSLSDQVGGPPAAEVSLALDRALAVDGRLHAGDLVDVYGTGDEGTSVVAADLRVVAVTAAGGSFSDGDQLTVTLAVPDGARQQAVIQAARGGTGTLVRTTHATRAASATGAGEPGRSGAVDPGSPGSAPGDGERGGG
jgi:SAF domain